LSAAAFHSCLRRRCDIIFTAYATFRYDISSFFADFRRSSIDMMLPPLRFSPFIVSPDAAIICSFWLVILPDASFHAVALL